MYVSLCGPHSFETSTLLLSDNEPALEAGRRGPPLWMYWYFSHHVGFLGSLCACAAGAARRTAARTAADVRNRVMGGSSLESFFPRVSSRPRSYRGRGRGPAYRLP